MDHLNELREIRSLPELMRAVLASQADEWQATDIIVAWMRAHPDVVRAVLAVE